MPHTQISWSSALLLVVASVVQAASGDDTPASQRVRDQVFQVSRSIAHAAQSVAVAARHDAQLLAERARHAVKAMRNALQPH